MKIVLASGSERRKELLGWLEVPFEVVESGADETIYPDEEASEAVARLALAKARSVADENMEDSIIIGADTVVEINGKIMGKPKDKTEAETMIKELSGRPHQVWTGVAVIDGLTGESRVEVESTEVVFQPLTDKQIEKFLDTGEWEGKAGAYMIQGEMGKNAASIKGSFTNVVGMPLTLVADMLESMGLAIEVGVEEIIRQKTGYES